MAVQFSKYTPNAAKPADGFDGVNGFDGSDGFDGFDGADSFDGFYKL